MKTKLSTWIAVGFVGQAMFFGRFLVQWIAAERRGEGFVQRAAVKRLSAGGARGERTDEHGTPFPSPRALRGGVVKYEDIEEGETVRIEEERKGAGGKPVVIEETFPLRSGLDGFRDFLEASAAHASGWIGFYWGKTPEECRAGHEVADRAVDPRHQVVARRHRDQDGVIAECPKQVFFDSADRRPAEANRLLDAAQVGTARCLAEEAGDVVEHGAVVVAIEGAEQRRRAVGRGDVIGRLRRAVGERAVPGLRLHVRTAEGATLLHS